MTNAFLVAAVAVFAAGMVQGCTGFGLALVASPLLMLVFPAASVVPTVILMSTLNTLLVAWESRRHLLPRVLVLLVAGSCLGLPIGTYLLRTVPGEYLKVVVGCVAVAFALSSLRGFKHPVKKEKWLLTPIGVLCGILGASTSMGGPPLALFLANQDYPKEKFRCTLIFYFLCTNCIAVAIFIYSGVLTPTIFRESLLLFPIMLAGTLVGIGVARWSPEEIFRRYVLFVVATMGCILAVTNAFKLLT